MNQVNIAEAGKISNVVRGLEAIALTLSAVSLTFETFSAINNESKF